VVEREIAAINARDIEGYRACARSTSRRELLKAIAS